MCANTARAAGSMGQEFYKCSLPEGTQRDFLQWADGVEGNLSPPAADDDGQRGAPGPSSGTTKDVVRERADESLAIICFKKGKRKSFDMLSLP